MCIYIYTHIILYTHTIHHNLLWQGEVVVPEVKYGFDTIQSWCFDDSAETVYIYTHTRIIIIFMWSVSLGDDEDDEDFTTLQVDSFIFYYYY